jgi:hypothetical protein
MAQIDLGKVKMTDEEIQMIVSNYLGGVKIGKDAEGNPGYYKYDESVGADTFVPFKNSGGISEFVVPFLPFNFAYTYASSSSFDFLRLNNNFHGFKKIKIEGRIGGRLTTASASNRTISIYFFYYEKNEDGTKGASKSIKVAVMTASTTGTKWYDFEPIEIDIENCFISENNNDPCNPTLRLNVGGTYSAGIADIKKITLS